MKDQFVTYEIAKKLKELGFNDSCFGAYMPSGQLWETQERDEDDIPAPLWQQAIDWLRAKTNTI